MIEAVVRQHLGDISIFIRPEFNASNRAKIREAIIAELARERGGLVDEIEAQTLRMLEHVPEPAGVSVSISHTTSLGGFALSRTQQVGFDIEDVARVNERIIKRITKPDEAGAPPAHIWVAKEAAYKALRGRPKVITSLTTGKWRSVATQENLSLWSCEVREDSAPNAICRGLTVELSNTAFGIFVVKP